MPKQPLKLNLIKVKKHFLKYNKIFNMKTMEEIIKKIEVSEEATKHCLEWLSKNKNNGLDDAYTTTLIRFLLKRVVELEKRIKEYEK